MGFILYRLFKSSRSLSDDMSESNRRNIRWEVGETYFVHSSNGENMSEHKKEKEP
jgi:hypothetical protein